MGAVNIASQFGVQAYAAVATTLYTLVATYIILKVIFFSETKGLFVF